MHRKGFRYEKAHCIRAINHGTLKPLSRDTIIWTHAYLLFHQYILTH